MARSIGKVIPKKTAAAAPVVKKPAAVANKSAAKKKVVVSKKSKKVIRRQGTMHLVAQEAQDYLNETEDAFQKRKEERQKLQKHADSILFPRKIKRSTQTKTKAIQKLPKDAVKSTTSSSASKPEKKESKSVSPKPTKAPATQKAPSKPGAKQTKPVIPPTASPKPATSPKPNATPKSTATSKPAKKESKKQPVTSKTAAPSKTHKIEKKASVSKSSVKKSAKKASAAPAAVVPDVAPSAEPAASSKQPVLKKKPSRAESKLIESGLATGMIDVVFCIDTTGSMDSYLEETKTTVNSIVTKVKELSKGESVSVRFGVVAYRDHPPQEYTYLTKTHDLSKDNEALDFLQTLDCTGGGDGAEAVFDGLLEASKSISWRDSKSLPSLRYIFHITDAPPHGDFYQGYSELWSSSGCPCGTDVNKVAHVINIEQIHYRLIKIGSKLTKMAEQFKEKFVNYEECPIDSAAGMDIKITDMIIRELVPDMAFD